MKLRSVCFSIPVFALVAACAAAQPIVNAIPDAAQCIQSAVESFVTGTPDVAGLMAHCGATVVDIEKVITALENQDGGVASASPERSAKIAAWKDALAKYKATHPNAK